MNDGFTIRIFDESWANINMPLLRGKRPPHHKQDIRKQFVEISYAWINFSIAEIIVL
jgi:hypothetical protein